MRQDTGSQVPARIIREPVCYGSRNKENGFSPKNISKNSTGNRPALHRPIEKRESASR